MGHHKKQVVHPRPKFRKENQLLSHIKVRGANMGPIGGRQDPGGPHVGPMNFAF